MSLSKNALPNLVEENTWNGWSDFFHGTSNILYPFETCTACDSGGSYEYRNYHDPYLNIKLTYIQFRGIGFKNDKWLKAYYPQEEHVDVVVTNVGLFGFHFTVNQAEYIETMRLIADKVVWKTTTFQDGEYSDPSWWSRPSHKRSPCNRTIMNIVDHRMCNHEGVLCLDTSWTATHVKSTNYWDTKHFKEPIYAMFNDALIDVLSKS